MFEFTSPCKLGSANSNMNSGVLEAESVKFSPFSGDLHLELAVCTRKLVSWLVSMCVQEQSCRRGCLSSWQEEDGGGAGGTQGEGHKVTSSNWFNITGNTGHKMVEDSACCSRYQRTSASKWETTSQGTKRVATTRIRPFSFQVLAWPGSCQCPYPVPLCFSYAFQHWKTVLSASVSFVV